VVLFRGLAHSMGSCLITPHTGAAAARTYRMPHVAFPTCDEAPEESPCSSPVTSTSTSEDSPEDSDSVGPCSRSESGGSLRGSPNSRHTGAKKKYHHNGTLTFKLRLPPSDSSASLPSLPGTVTSSVASAASSDRASARMVRIESVPLSSRSGCSLMEELEEMSSETALSRRTVSMTIHPMEGPRISSGLRLPPVTVRSSSDPRLLSAPLPGSRR